MITAIQKNGERLHLEDWVFTLWIYNQLDGDPELKAILDNAVKLIFDSKY